LLFVVAIRRLSSLEGSKKSIKKKERSRKPVSRVRFPFFLNFDVFDSFSIFRRTKNRENVQNGQKEGKKSFMTD
jgi:uncharacterized linocin/CFP29 family protein